MTTRTLISRLRAVRETPVAPAWLVAVTLGQPARIPADVDETGRALNAEAERIASARQTLLAVPPAGPRRPVVLL